MPIIQALEAENFMSHQATTVALSPGVNLISGHNRSGKTNLLRALRWVLFNDGPPYSDNANDDTLRYGQGDSKAPFARVRVTMDNGAWVERYRSAGRNEYHLCPAGGEEELHSGPGQGFYDPVGAITGIFPVDIAGDSMLIGWQGVFDSKLLVGDSAQAVDKQLTHMIGVNVLEAAARSAEGDKRTHTSAATHHREQLGSLNGALGQFDGLDHAEVVVAGASTAIMESDHAVQAVSSCREAASMRSRAAVVLGQLGVVDATVRAGKDKAALLLARARSFSENREAGAHASQSLVVANGLIACGSAMVTEAKQHVEHAAVLSAQSREAVATTEGATYSRIVFDAAAHALATNSVSMQTSQAVLTTLRKERELLLEQLDICPKCGRAGTCPHCGGKVAAR